MWREIIGGRIVIKIGKRDPCPPSEHNTAHNVYT